MRQNRNVLHGSGDPCHALTSPCRAKARNPGKKRARRVPLHGGHCFLSYPKNPPLSGGDGKTIDTEERFSNQITGPKQGSRESPLGYKLNRALAHSLGFAFSRFGACSYGLDLSPPDRVLPLSNLCAGVIANRRCGQVPAGKRFIPPKSSQRGQELFGKCCLPRILVAKRVSVSGSDESLTTFATRFTSVSSGGPGNPRHRHPGGFSCPRSSPFAPAEMA